MNLFSKRLSHPFNGWKILGEYLFYRQPELGNGLKRRRSKYFSRGGLSLASPTQSLTTLAANGFTFLAPGRANIQSKAESGFLSS